MPFHRTKKESVTDLDGPVKPVLIGRVQDGTGSVLELEPKFQHHSPKKITVELGILDGSKKLLCQDWVKLLTLKFVLLVIIVIVFIPLTYKLEIVESTFCITYPMFQIVTWAIALNNYC